MRRLAPRLMTLLAASGLMACPADPKPAKPAEKAASEPDAASAPAPGIDRAALAKTASALFGPVVVAESTAEPKVAEAMVELGRLLYFEKRLSKNHDLSCNTCHDLAQYGVDVREKDGKRMATSLGHKGQLGARNSPTVYNAFVHANQFWDGRAKDVEEQAKGPILNPVEMAMKDEVSAVKVLESIPGYKDKFAAAFPDAKKPISYDNMAKAIGAFERRLTTPAPFDAFLAGKHDALDEAQLEGLDLFMKKGCIACHMGPAVGGMIMQKLGLLKPYPTKDAGRFEVTSNEADRFFFKTPSLRNITKTGPYLHDGSVETLEEMVGLMAVHQTPGGALSDDELKKIVRFLGALEGEIDAEYTKEPAALESGKKTPKPDPS